MRASRRRSARWWHGRCSDVGRLRYLIFLSNKYNVNPYALLNALIEAEKKSTAECDCLRITLRSRGIDDASFLITKRSGTVAQVRMGSDVWRNPRDTRHLYSILIEDEQLLKKRYNLSSLIKHTRESVTIEPLRPIDAKRATQTAKSRLSSIVSSSHRLVEQRHGRER